MATKKIGVGAGLVTADYTDVTSWESYLNGLGTFSEDEIGRVMWASSANEISAGGTTFDGSTPGSFGIILEAGDASGSAVAGSFRDHASATNNVLRYNPSLGASLVQSSGAAGWVISDPNFTVRYLQIKRTSTYNLILQVTAGTSGATVDSCIFCVDVDAGSSPYLTNTVADTTIKNSVLYHSGLKSPAVGYLMTHGGGGTCRYHNCTIAMTGSAAAALRAIEHGFNTIELKNCVIYGTNRDLTSTAANVFATNATWLSTASSSLQPSSTVFNIVSTDFVSVTRDAEDFRLSSALSTLVGAGSTSTSTLTVDIIGQTRS